MKTVRFPFSGSFLLAPVVVTKLREGAFRHEVQIEISQLGGWLRKSYGVVVTGDDEKVDGFMAAVKDYFKRMKATSTGEESVETFR